jgi:hypothetical protein
MLRSVTELEVSLPPLQRLDNRPVRDSPKRENDRAIRLQLC